MTTEPMTTVETMDLTGEPWLDFINTGSRLRERYADPAAAEAAGYGPFGDRLESYGDLVRWAERVGLVESGEARVLQQLGVDRPVAAATVLADARALREALYRVVAAEQAGRRGAAEDLDVLEQAVRAAWSRRSLVATDAGYDLVWQRSELGRVLWPVATGALDALLSPERVRVKQCHAAECNWLFRDASRNRSRRWCEMSACGNRAKARRYYERHG